MEKFIIGIDVSKEKLDVCLFDGQSILEEKLLCNAIDSLRNYLRDLQDRYNLLQGDVLICAEYTGHYIYPLCLLSQQGYHVWIEHPSQIKYHSGLSRGKNDKTDARKIAYYAFRYKDKARLYSLPLRSISRLKHLVTERDMYVVDKAKYQAQLKDQEDFMDASQYRQKKVRLSAIIELLQRQIVHIEEEIFQVITQDELLNGQYNLLLSITGVGKTVATKMIVETGAFADFTDGRKFCSHAGVAPFEYTSGSSIRSRNRVSHRADKSIKKLLHLAAMSAIRTPGELREYYLRKTKQGKAKMSVLNAIRAKLVLRMFAVIRDNKIYQKNYQFQVA